MREERIGALTDFHQEVRQGNFPYPATNITMKPGEKNRFLEALDAFTPTHS